MLRHEDNQETPAPTAAQVRVTPEELAKALSRIEARKEIGERHVEGTIPIGEAVQQLGVETTPEEVLAEVQAIRQEPTTSKARWPFVAKRLVLALSLGGVLLGLVLDGNGLLQIKNHQVSQSATANIPKPTRTPKLISLDPNMMVQVDLGDGRGKLVTFSMVGDNQPARCFYSAGSFQPYSRSDEILRESWTLVKHRGRVYVRGWLPHMSDREIRQDGADIGTWESDYNDAEPSHDSHTRVTLPLDGFQVGAGGDRDREIHALNIHLDKHAYEKWKP